jgi:predicted SprT family Zn-dependent metalloprotease
MLKQRIEMVKTRVKELVAKANKLYGITLPEVDVRFDLRGRCAGVAGHQWGHYYMRFNVDMMQNSAWDHLYNDTVPHELAHIVCYFKPQLGRNHDGGWKRVCRALGGNGERCHNEEVVYAHGTVYYTSSTGEVIPVSRQRHAKIQRGASYGFRGKGRLDRQCQYSLKKPAAPQAAPVVQPAVKPATVPVVQAAPVVAGSSKADQVRAKIRECKQAGQGRQTAIDWAIMVLGMNKTLARTYVENNWLKA